MATKTTKSVDSYREFAGSLKAGRIANFYIFHGDERYLLDHSLDELRSKLCPGGLEGFNYRRYEGKDLRIDELEDAINTLPVFAERTLVELQDFDIFSGEVKQRLAGLFSTCPVTFV